MVSEFSGAGDPSPPSFIGGLQNYRTSCRGLHGILGGRGVLTHAGSVPGCLLSGLEQTTTVSIVDHHKNLYNLDYLSLFPRRFELLTTI